MSKPRIVVVSADSDEEFNWLSDGWYTVKQRHTPKARALFAKAVAAIEAADDVPDTIRRLREAGFEVVRDGDLVTLMLQENGLCN